MGRRLPTGRITTALALVAAAAVLAGCGGGSGGLSSVRSSLPSSLPTVTRTSTTTTSTTTPPTTTVTTTTTTTATVATTSTAGSGSETPWGWIAAIAILVVLAVGDRRLGARPRAGGARQLARTGAAGECRRRDAERHRARRADRGGHRQPPRRRGRRSCGAADELSASLHRLEASPPDDAAGSAVQGAIGALTALRSVLAVALSAPEGIPLDEGVRDTTRQRLADLATALTALRGQAGG